MGIDAPKDIPTQQLKCHDESITQLGKFLRKILLDELPQLFNILRREMRILNIEKNSSIGNPFKNFQKDKPQY